MKIDKSILKKYSKGICSDEENALIESWFDQFHREEEMSLDDFLYHLESLDSKIYQKLNSQKLYRKYLSLAASLLVILGIAALFLYKNQGHKIISNSKKISSIQEKGIKLIINSDEEYSLDHLKRGDSLKLKDVIVTKLEDGELKYISVNEFPESQLLTIQTNAASTTSIILSDESKVWLNANSKIKYPLHFRKDIREVFLEGEGYFEVKSSNSGSVPFIVNGGNHLISVIGTKFNVNLRNGNEVALLEGKVSISKIPNHKNFHITDSSFILLPNQVYSDGQLQTEVDVFQYIDWKEGYFNLNNQTLAKVCERLSNWYGVSISVEKSLQSKELIGKISQEKELEEVLDLISMVLPVKYAYKDETLYLTSN
jgi:transmembrane sensor